MNLDELKKYDEVVFKMNGIKCFFESKEAKQFKEEMYDYIFEYLTLAKELSKLNLKEGLKRNEDYIKIREIFKNQNSKYDLGENPIYDLISQSISEILRDSKQKNYIWNSFSEIFKLNDSNAHHKKN